MIQWLIDIGCNTIHILDNDSSYPPLLSYYENLPLNVNLHKLSENLGPWAFWQLRLQNKVTSPYIVSDSDLIPSEFCPEDLIAHMFNVLSRFPDCGKIAPGLRVDSISSNYGQGASAVIWESQFWHRPVLRGVFSAPVDTTFALYPAGAEFSNGNNNFRLGYPYLLEHTPWHVDENNLDEEEVYYRENTSRAFSHWSAKSLDPRIENSAFMKNYGNLKNILHLGCGNEYIPGWINIDISGRKLDIKYDLNKCRTQRLPIEENSVDGFYMCHVFEHIEDSLALMEELYRVAKHGAKIHIRLPYGASNDAWEDPTNSRAYFESSFIYFSQPAYSRADYGYTGDWQTDQITLLIGPDLLKMEPQQAYEIIRTQRNIVSEMIVELSAVKPARQRLLSLLKNGPITLASDPRILPSFSQ